MAARSKDVYREACRRSHRILGNYLVLRAWSKRADCLYLDRGVLLRYLGVGAMRETACRDASGCLLTEDTPSWPGLAAQRLEFRGCQVSEAHH